MDDSKELKNRIIQMRHDNHIVPSQDSEIESSKSTFGKEIDNKDTSVKKNEEGKNEKQNINHDTNVLKKEEAFKLLANKFNDAVEVILELTKRVEKLETIVRLQSMQAESLKNKTEKYTNRKSNLKFYILFFVIIFASYIFYYDKIDLSIVSLIFDEISKIFNKS